MQFFDAQGIILTHARHGVETYTKEAIRHSAGKPGGVERSTESVESVSFQGSSGDVEIRGPRISERVD